jgi:diguanylate cyclase (GGDEF)-like protein
MRLWNRHSFPTAALLLGGTLALTPLPPVAADSLRIRFDRLSVDDGLAQQDVHAILQDRLGFIWIGTQEGLNRFDGHDFDTWQHDPGDPTSLGHNWIQSLLEDRAGNLWVGTKGGGLNLWDPERDAFTRFRSNPSNPHSLSSDRVRVLFEDSGGELWIGTDGGGLNRFDRETSRFQRFLHDPGEPTSLHNNRILCILEDRAGQFWLGTDGGGLDRFDPDTGQFTSYLRSAENPRGIDASRVRTVFEDSPGVLWIGTYEDGLFRYETESDSYRRFDHDPRQPSTLSSDRVRTIHRDAQGLLWIGTDGGLNLWQPDSQSFTRFVFDPADPHSISADRVMTVFQDRGGVLWVGVQSGGLNKWNSRSGLFTTYGEEPDDPGSLSDNVVTSLAEEPDGTIWVGTYGGGLNRRDPASNQFRHYRHDPANPHSLGDDRVMSLLIDSKGVLWAGTYEGGLHRFDRGSGRFEHFTHRPGDPRSISGNGITVIYESRDGFLWIGTLHGLNRFDRRDGRFVSYQHDPGNPTSLSGDRVLAIVEDSAGDLWVGTDGSGLNRFDRASGAFSRYRFDASNERSLSGDSVTTIAEDSAGELWIGTQSGLNRWEPASRAAFQGVFRRYSQADGLPNSSIWGILEDDANNLWLSTNNGLSRLGPRRQDFKNFDVSHGLESNEFNNGAYFRGPSGRMLFGGNQGFTSFFPSEIRDNSYAPPIVLTSFLKANTEVDLERPAGEVQQIRLGHEDLSVEFEFAALDFTAPERNLYAYQLLGFKQEWFELGNRRRATFTNLDPGEYTLKVKAANNDGVWSEPTELAHLLVAPAPWRSWWAYTIYGLVLVTMAVSYARGQAQKLRREAEYSRNLEKEVRERTSELAERNRELQLAKKKSEEASFTDSLTGIKNRRFLINTIDRDIASVERFYAEHEGPIGDLPEERPDILFLLFDLDGFKTVNDTYGHSAGDLVLIQVRDLLERACRRSDTLVRWGGDEFLVVCRGSHIQMAEGLAERIRSSVAAHEFDVGNGRPMKLTCSIGFAHLPFVPMRPRLLGWEQVVNIADRALYMAKQKGRDGWAGLSSHPSIASVPDHQLAAAVTDSCETLLAEGRLRSSSSFRADEPAHAAG